MTIHSLYRSTMGGLLVGCLSLAVTGCGNGSSDMADPNASTTTAPAARTADAPASSAMTTAAIEKPSSSAPPAARVEPAPAGTATGTAAPATAPADPSSPASAATGDPTAMAGSGSNTPAGEPTKEPDKPPITTVYVCQQDDVVAIKAGHCPVCRQMLTVAELGNPDPAVCPVDGNKIEHPYYGLVARQPYAFDSPNCVLLMRKDPVRYLEDARHRAGVDEQTPKKPAAPG